MQVFRLMLFCAVLSGAAYILSGPIGRAITVAIEITARFLHGSNGVKDWDTLCREEDCGQLPKLHMTYEIDGKRYYFPAPSYTKKLRDGTMVPTGPLFGYVLPQNVPRSETWLRNNYAVQDRCCVGWTERGIDFDLYLETRPEDHRVIRGFARFTQDTGTMDMRRNASGFLPKYYGIDTTHPSGKLRELSIVLHSRENRSEQFLLTSRLRSLRQSIGFHRKGAKQSEPMIPLLSAADLPHAGFPSIGDAFWIIADVRRDKYRGPYLFNGLAVVSKSPMLHSRHVYGYCNERCRFYSLWFRDDPPNEEPLLRVDMHGDDIDVLLQRSCANEAYKPECDPTKVSLKNIRSRFELVEQVITELRKPPITRVD